MKNYIIIGLLFGCFFSAFGQSHVSYPQYGVYGGLETGVARVVIYGTFTIEDEELIRRDYTKSVISVNLGYGKYIGESFIGIEGHHSIYTKKIADSYIQGNYNFDTSITAKSELDLIIGRKIGVRSLITLRGGVAFSNINLTANYNSGNDKYVLDKKWNGYSLGMGYVYGINENLSIKSKYNLTTFNNNSLAEAKSKLVDNRFTLSVIYRIWSDD